MNTDDKPLLFMWTDRWLVLLARGWTIEWVDERYWSVLLKWQEPT